MSRIIGISATMLGIRNEQSKADKKHKTAEINNTDNKKTSEPIGNKR